MSPSGKESRAGEAVTVGHTFLSLPHSLGERRKDIVKRVS